MSQKIFSFSVSNGDSKKLGLISRIRAYCDTTGKSFTWVILDALAKWEKENVR